MNTNRNANTYEALVEREKFLEDVMASLKDMHGFALSVKDWPRAKQAKLAMNETRERLLSVAMKLSVVTP